jgi:hypothetical protein
VRSAGAPEFPFISIPAVQIRKGYYCRVLATDVPQLVFYRETGWNAFGWGIFLRKTASQQSDIDCDCRETGALLAVAGEK